MAYLDAATAASDGAVVAALKAIAVVVANGGNTDSARDALVSVLVQRARRDDTLPHGSTLRTTAGMLADLQG